jgi:hypothetical protein
MGNTSDTQEPSAPAKPTRKKKRRSNRPEMLSRNVEISSFTPTMRLHAIHEKSDEPYLEAEPWLELRGRAQSPTRASARSRSACGPGMT